VEPGPRGAGPGAAPAPGRAARRVPGNGRAPRASPREGLARRAQRRAGRRARGFPARSRVQRRHVRRHAPRGGARLAARRTLPRRMLSNPCASPGGGRSGRAHARGARLAPDRAARAGSEDARRALARRHAPLRGGSASGLRRLQPVRGLVHPRGRAGSRGATRRNADGVPGAADGGRGGREERPRRRAPPEPHRRAPHPDPRGRRRAEPRLRDGAPASPRGDHVGGHGLQQRAPGRGEPRARHRAERALPGRLGHGPRRLQQLPGELHARGRSPRDRTRRRDPHALRGRGRDGAGAPVPGRARDRDALGARPRHAGPVHRADGERVLFARPVQD
jgi:hypothetical protein